jgi:hypothetical protein
MSEEREQYQTQALAKIDEVMNLGDVLHKSGYFSDVKSQAQAVVKVLAGREIGIPAIASMKGIHIIQGQPSIGAVLMGAIIKRSNRYNYRVTKMTDEEVTIEFFERDHAARDWAPIGVSSFSKSDAQKAQTKNMGAYPRNMLFARAMSNGARWYCPDVFAGAIYTPDELGGHVDAETGEIIDAQIIEPSAPAPSPTPPPAPHTNGDPLAPDALLASIRKVEALYAEQYGDSPIDTESMKRVAGALGKLVGDANRPVLLKRIANVDSTKELRRCTGAAILKWLGIEKAGFVATRPQAQAEADALLADRPDGWEQEAAE